MDKRKSENMRVKNAITGTVFKLIQQRSLDDVTISDIIRSANVARASFYRNYSSKEDVLVTVVREVLDKYQKNAPFDLSDYTSKKNVKRAFYYFYKYKKYILNLYNSGFGTMLLEEFNQFQEMVAGSMPANSPKRYHLYSFMGALYNTAIVWLKEDNPVTAEVLTEVFLENVFCTE